MYSFLNDTENPREGAVILNLNKLKGHSSGQSHFSEINIKLAEKNKYATRSIQRSLEMCENKEKPSVSEDFRQKSSTSDVEKFHQ